MTMKIGKVLDEVYDRSVGWRPATGALKPVHIANGLFRGLLGEVYNIKVPLSFVIPWKKKNSPDLDPQRTYNYLVHETSDPRFQAFRDEQYKERFERLRDYARELLNADGGVFPDPEMVSFSLTCRQMISKDHMDKEVGRFIAELLRGEDGNGPLAKLVIECLTNEQPLDPITFLAWPLLSNEPEYASKKSTRCSPHGNPDLKKYFDLLGKAAAELADHQRQQGNRLATLQKTVHFACLSLLGHAQTLAADGNLAKRSPLLLTMAAPKNSRLASASEESLNRYYESFESWLVERLAERLEKGKPIAYGTDEGEREPCQVTLPANRKDSVRKFLNEFNIQEGQDVDPKVIDDRMSLYEQAVANHGRDNWALVIAETLVQCYLNEYESGGPRKFLSGVGRKAGIIYPHFAGRSKDKRIRPSVSILDVLVKCCTPPDGAIPFNAFLDCLWERFGIVVGGRMGDDGSDHELLNERDIDIGQADLEENTKAFIDHLVEIGLARRYPDNIAYVGRYYA